MITKNDKMPIKKLHFSEKEQKNKVTVDELFEPNLDETSLKGKTFTVYTQTEDNIAFSTLIQNIADGLKRVQVILSKTHNAVITLNNSKSVVLSPIPDYSKIFKRQSEETIKSIVGLVSDYLENFEKSINSATQKLPSITSFDSSDGDSETSCFSSFTPSSTNADKPHSKVEVEIHKKNETNKSEATEITSPNVQSQNDSFVFEAITDTQNYRNNQLQYDTISQPLILSGHIIDSNDSSNTEPLINFSNIDNGENVSQFQQTSKSDLSSLESSHIFTDIEAHSLFQMKDSRVFRDFQQAMTTPGSTSIALLPEEARPDISGNTSALDVSLNNSIHSTPELSKFGKYFLRKRCKTCTYYEVNCRCYCKQCKLYCTNCKCQF